MEKFIVSFQERDCYIVFRKWQSPFSTYMLGDTPDLETGQEAGKSTYCTMLGREQIMLIFDFFF